MISKLFNDKNSYPIKGYSLLSVEGEDASTFLNGQLTTNIFELLPGTFKSFHRLDPKGQILYNGYVFKAKNKYYLMVKEDASKLLQNNLEMFIISEDVELKLEVNFTNIYFSANYNHLNSSSLYVGLFHFTPGFIDLNYQGDEIQNFKEEANLEFLKNLSIMNNGLFNENLHSAFSNHNNKGCFVGQEVVRKIENNRGARLFPLLFKLNSGCNVDALDSDVINELSEKCGKVLWQGKIANDEYLIIHAKRELHLSGKIIKFQICGQEVLGVIELLLDNLEDHYKNYSEELFIKAVDLMNQDKISESSNLLKLSLAANAHNTNSLEALGVIYGRKKKYALAHKLMDQLLKIDKFSIMAHTNKSLFYMNEGKIEEAEQEKEQALKKSTSQETNKNLIEQKSEQIKKLNKQLEMYKEVLEIDPSDNFAQNKYVEILYTLEKFTEVIEYLNNLDLDKNPKLFIWLFKSLETSGLPTDEIRIKAPALLDICLKQGDKKSSDFLKRIL